MHYEDSCTKENLSTNELFRIRHSALHTGIDIQLFLRKFIPLVRKNVDKFNKPNWCLQALSVLETIISSINDCIEHLESSKDSSIINLTNSKIDDYMYITFYYTSEFSKNFNGKKCDDFSEEYNEYVQWLITTYTKKITIYKLQKLIL